MSRQDLVITVVSIAAALASGAVSLGFRQPAPLERETVELRNAEVDRIIEALRAGKIVVTEHGTTIGHGPVANWQPTHWVKDARWDELADALRKDRPADRQALASHYEEIARLETLCSRSRGEAALAGRAFNVHGRMGHSGLGVRALLQLPGYEVLYDMGWDLRIDPETGCAIPDVREWRRENRWLSIFSPDAYAVGSTPVYLIKLSESHGTAMARRRAAEARMPVEVLAARFNALPLGDRRAALERHEAGLAKISALDVDALTAQELRRVMLELDEARLPDGLTVNRPDYVAVHR